jgi:hypothetical protein
LNLLKDTGYIHKQKGFTVPCFRCGVCCSKYQVRLTLEEAQRIAAELQITWDEFVNVYLDLRWPGTESFLLRQGNRGCIFLKQGKGESIASCLIHSFRPSSCRDWAPGLNRPECLEGLSRYWALSVDSNGELKGTGEEMQRFQEFLESITK